MAIDPSLINAGFGPPPLQTPMHGAGVEEFGMPAQLRGLQGPEMDPGWANWFNLVGSALNPRWHPQCDINGVILPNEAPFPALQAGWVNSNIAIYGLPAFALAGKLVLLRGQLSGGTIADGTLIFTLPVPVRPPFLVRGSIATATAGLVWGSAHLFLGNDGTVKLFGAVAGTTFITIHCALALF